MGRFLIRKNCQFQIRQSFFFKYEKKVSTLYTKIRHFQKRERSAILKYEKVFISNRKCVTFKYEKCLFFKYENVPFSKTSDARLLNTKVLQFSDIKNVPFSNAKNESNSNTKTRRFEIRKMWSVLLLMFEINGTPYF